MAGRRVNGRADKKGGEGRALLKDQMEITYD